MFDLFNKIKPLKRSSRKYLKDGRVAPPLAQEGRGSTYEILELFKCDTEEKKTQAQINAIFDNSNIVQQIISYLTKGIPNINFKLYSKISDDEVIPKDLTNIFESITTSCYDTATCSYIDFNDFLTTLVKTYIYRGGAVAYCYMVNDELMQIGIIEKFKLTHKANQAPELQLDDFEIGGEKITKVQKANSINANYDYVMNSEGDYIRFFPLIFNKSSVDFAITPLYSAMKQLEIYQEQLKTTRAIFQNQAKPSIIVTSHFVTQDGLGYDSEVATNQAKISANIKNELQGSLNAGKGLVLQPLANVKHDIHQISPTIQHTYDIDMVDKISVEIAGLVGIPAGKLIPQRTFANAAEDTKELGYAIFNTLQKVLNVFTKQVFYNIAQTYGVSMYQQYNISFDNTDITEIKESESKYVRGLGDAGYKKINEVREAVGDKPVPDGDRFVTNNQSNNAT